MKKLYVYASIAAFLFTTVPVSAANEDKIAAKAIRQTPPAPVFTDAERQAELLRRRQAAGALMKDNSTLVLFSAEPKIYAGDVNFMYRQENNLYYLTNIKKGGAALILTKSGGSVNEYLFLPKRNPQYETWNGRRLSNEDAIRISGVRTIVDAAELENFLTALKTKKSYTAKSGATVSFGSENLYLLVPESPIDNDAKREYRKETEFAGSFAKTLTNPATNSYVYEPTAGYKIENAQGLFGKLRLTKSPYEIRLMQHAIDITTEAQGRAMATAGQVKWEYETQAEIEYVFRRRNADYWGYPSIVGCGPNATTLHYEESQGAVGKGDLLLMDVGAEYDHYTADVTRTFPISGKFTKEQADIYQIVYDAQEAAASKLKPGARFNEAGKAADAVIEQGLAKLGLITKVGAFVPGTEREITDGKGNKQTVGFPQFRVFYMHGLGHWLGMNVHDVGDYGTPLAEGMIMTNEPGIYVREDALAYFPDSPAVKAYIEQIRPAFERYKNIGVRIEDDMLITKTGVEWMTKDLPRKMNEIEAFMARASKEVTVSAAPKRDDLRLSVVNSDANLLLNGTYYSNSVLNGATVRRGWIHAGKAAAQSGLSHLHHASDE
jgi:Xaa-Pro aminopeptidase